LAEGGQEECAKRLSGLNRLKELKRLIGLTLVTLEGFDDARAL
jgi:hypothetical protein